MDRDMSQTQNDMRKSIAEASLASQDLLRRASVGEALGYPDTLVNSQRDYKSNKSYSTMKKKTSSAKNVKTLSSSAYQSKMSSIEKRN
jgi:hypothetical protein